MTTDGAPELTKLSWQKRLRGACLTPVEYMVLMTMSTYTDRHLRNAHPGWARLVHDTGLDVRTIKKAVTYLRGAGFLVLEAPGGNQYGKGTANVYAVSLPEITKGHTGRPPSDDDAEQPRGTSGATRGTSGADEGGHGVYPHQVLSPGPKKHHSDSSESGPMQSSLDARWTDLVDNYDAFETWLEDTIGLEDIERNIALGMWEDRYHPLAIANTIRSGRAA